MTAAVNAGDVAPADDPGFSMLDVVLVLVSRWRQLVLLPLLAGITAIGITYLIAPTFTSRTVFLPPQQQQSAAASALASLGALSGLAGAAVGIKSPIDQYVALMQSVTVQDRLIDEFQLMQVYKKKLRVDARKELTRNVRISTGKKDGLITVEVEDEDPQRAAAIANRHVEELRRLTNQLALTEAQQRRAFFQEQLEATRDRLTKAQVALQASGYTPGALKAEPKAAAEGYARVRAEVTAAEVRLRTLRQRLADNAPEVQQQLTLLAALRAELSRLESNGESPNDAGYIGKFREFKYQETLFELFSRQYEIARLDESREGALIQVVDTATPAEKKTRPARAIAAVITTIVVFFVLAAFHLVRWAAGRSRPDPAMPAPWDRVRSAARGR